jgi:hypothetical protein
MNLTQLLSFQKSKISAEKHLLWRKHLLTSLFVASEPDVWLAWGSMMDFELP